MSWNQWQGNQGWGQQPQHQPQQIPARNWGAAQSSPNASWGGASTYLARGPDGSNGAANQASVNAQGSWGGSPQVQPGAAAPGQRYIVYSTGNDSEDFVIKTISGEFVLNGENHGKPSFQKQTVDATAPPCFIYYWDSRDGPSFEGWWFGRQVGGNEVWSHNSNGQSPTPPGSGWKVPFAGPVRETLVVTTKAAHEAQQNAQKNQAAAGALNAIWQEVQNVTWNANQALSKAKETAGSYDSFDNLVAAEKMISPHIQAIADLQKKVSSSGTDPSQNGSQEIRSCMQNLNIERRNLQLQMPKAQELEKKREADKQDQEMLQSMVHEATNKCNEAEDLVEKAGIAAEMIEAAGDDIKEAQVAISQTEKAAKEAQDAVMTTLTSMTTALSAPNISKLKSPDSRKQLSNEIGAIKQRLTGARDKVAKLRTLRQEFNQKQLAKAAAKEVLDKLTIVEVEVDKVEEFGTTLSEARNPSKEDMAEFEKKLSAASTSVNNILKMIDVKKQKCNFDAGKAELATIEDRTRKSLSRLTSFKSTLQVVKEKLTTGSLLSDVGDKVKAAEDSLEKSVEAQGQDFLSGLESMPLQDTLASVKATEAATATTTKLINTAKIAIRMKDVETKRFSEAAALEAKTQLAAFTESLEKLSKKLDALKATAAERKRGAIKSALETRVAEAEEQARKLAEAAAVFADDASVAKLSASELRVAASAFADAHTGSTNAMSLATELVTQQQIANKSAEVSATDTAMLSEFQSRLRQAQATANAHQKLPEVVERQLLVGKAIEEAVAKIKVVEEKVAYAVEAGEKALKAAPEMVEKEEEYMTLKAEFDKAHGNAQTFLRTLPRFMELQKKSKPVCKEELAKLEEERLSSCQERLNSVAKSLQEAEDKKGVESLLKEVESKVNEAEEAVSQATEEAKLLEGQEGAEADSSALEKFDKAVHSAQKAHTAAKTFLAVKRLAAKRMGSLQSATLEGLAVQQNRIDSIAEKISQIRKGSSNRKFAAAKKEVEAKMKDAEEKVNAVTGASASLCKAVEEAAVADEMDPLKIKGEFLAAAKAQKEATSALDDAQRIVRDQLRDLKSKSASADAEALEEFKKLLEDLSPLQATLDKEKEVLSNNEQMFVAHRLRKGADQKFLNLEKHIERAKELAAPLISEKKRDFVASILLSQVMTKLRAAVKKPPADVYKAMRGGDAKLLETRFVDFVSGLSDSGDKAAVVSEEQLKSAFAFMSGGAGEVEEKDFVLHFKPRYLCVAPVSVTEAMKVLEDKEPIHILEIGDVLEGIEEPVLDEETGMLRMRVRCADGVDGFVTVSGNGSAFLEAYSLYRESQSKLGVAFKDVNESLEQTMTYLKSKAEEIKTSGSGPLAEVKSEFTKLRVKASKEQNAHSLLEKRIGEAKKHLDKLIEDERRRTQEAVDRAAATALLRVANESVEKVLEEVAKSLAEAESLLAKKGKDRDDAFEAMATATEELEAGSASLLKALEKTIRPKMDELPVSGTGPLGEARKTLQSLKSKLLRSKDKSKKMVTDLQAIREEVSLSANVAVRDVLRDHLQSTSTSPHDLFEKLADKKDILSVDSFKAFLKEKSSDRLTAIQVQLGLHRYATGGIGKLDFLMMAEEFLRCLKEVAMTNTFEVKKSATVRKLENGEIVTVIGERGKDKTAGGLERVKCRALSDGAEGFVTLKGNQGTGFMKAVAKPLYMTEEEIPLFKSCDSAGEITCRLPAFDVLEIVEGPRQAPTVEIERVRGKAHKDGKIGWINLKDITSESQKSLACCVTTAMTDCFDVTACKAVRKIEVGEVLLQLEDVKEDTLRKLVRVHCKAKKDGVEGWATMKGNQGTEYLTVTDAHRESLRPTDLQSSFASSSRKIRTLAEGEEFEVLEGPKIEKQPGAFLKKCRSLANGSEGWITSVESSVSEWTPVYKCVKGIDLKASEGEKSDIVRALEVDEVVHALRSPSRAQGDAALVLKIRAEKDGAIGFARLKDDDGKAALKAMWKDS